MKLWEIRRHLARARRWREVAAGRAEYQAGGMRGNISPAKALRKAHKAELKAAQLLLEGTRTRPGPKLKPDSEVSDQALYTREYRAARRRAGIPRHVKLPPGVGRKAGGPAFVSVADGDRKPDGDRKRKSRK